MIHTQQVVRELNRLISHTPETTRISIRDCIYAQADELATLFYNTLLEDELAKGYLNHGLVKERLHTSLMRWLKELYGVPHQDPEALVKRQRQVGEVHARIRLPMHLVTRGARVLKARIFSSLEKIYPNKDQLTNALRFVGHMMDLALEVMSASYENGSQRNSRADEAYRHYSIGHNMSAERERQRSNLLEWGHGILLALYKEPSLSQLDSIGASEFGLWLVHKGCSVFDGSPELASIQTSMETIDHHLLPELKSKQKTDEGVAALVGKIETELDTIQFQLASLFDRYLEMESGRDTLTRLFNRRFLPSVISREITIANRQDEQFALMLVDLDHFKAVNDGYGHEAGDLVLQQSANLILNNVRSGDFVFRYGGEELLVLLVNVSTETAREVADQIRGLIEKARFSIGHNQSLQITCSIGLAMFDGHPDYQHLIQRADAAMYQAKNSGRNQVCVK